MKLPLHQRCRLLTHHAAGLVAIDKAEGLRSHPNDTGPDLQAVLLTQFDAEEECYRDGDGNHWFLCNRLDAPTSGIVLLCGAAALADAVRRLFRDREVEKVYHAIVKGRPHRRQAIWRDRLQTRGGGGAVRTAKSGSGQDCLTEMRLEGHSRQPPVVSLLKLHPKTGRTHQLRVQAASRHLPVIGDATYGDFRFNREYAHRTGVKRMLLHCSRLEFTLRHQGRTIRFSAKSPVPQEFSLK